MHRRLLPLLLAIVALAITAPAANARITPTPLGGTAWRMRTIRVFDATPLIYHEGVNIAMREWNANRVGVSFVKTTNRRTANVIVVARNLPGSTDGTGTLGAWHPAVLTLDTSLIVTEPIERNGVVYDFGGGAYPEAIAGVAAHEFGHILGLNHTTGCSLMRTTGLGGCGLTPPSGRWTCRLAQVKDLLALRRRYHGAGVLRANPYCLLSATASGKVGAITVSPSTASTATKLNWRNTTNNYGYVATRGVAGGGCPATPDSGTRRTLDVSELSESWYDVPATAARYCYAIWSKNGRGALAGPTRIFVDVAPPAAATVAPITNFAGTASGSDVTLTWTSPPGTNTVRIYRSDTPGSKPCTVPPFFPVIVARGVTETGTDTGLSSGTWTYVATRSTDPADDGEGDAPPPIVSAPVCIDVVVP